MAFDRNVASDKTFWVLFALCILLLTVDSKTTVLKVPRAVASSALYPISYIGSIPARFYKQVDVLLLNEPDIDTAYQHLRVEYVKLKTELLKRDAIELENARLRALLGAQKSSDSKMQIGKAIQIDLDTYQHRILVNRGGADSVYVGQAVIDDKGIIGQVSEVFRSTAVVTLLTDPSHAIPVRIKRNGYHLLAEGSGNLSLLRIPFLNKNTDIISGDVLETSGLGGRFPAGYPVAKVATVSSSRGESFLNVSAKPIAGVASLDYVLFFSSFE